MSDRYDKTVIVVSPVSYNKETIAYVFRELLVEICLFVYRRPQFDIVVDAGSSQDWQVRMWLQAIDNVMIRLQQHTQPGSVPLPYKHVTAVTT